MNFGIFIDIGGTYIRFGVCGVSEESPEIVIQTPCHKSEILSKLHYNILLLKQQYPNVSNTLLVSCPGMITTDGIVSKALYIDLVNINLRKELEHLCGMYVILENDANVQALGRYNGKDDLLYITIGTAVGGAYVNKNGIFRGNDGFACEFGHIFVDSKEVCFCGRKGCLDSVLSGRRIIERFGEGWWKRGDNNDIEGYLTYCGSKLVNALETLCAAFNPGEVVICGQICDKENFRNSVRRDFGKTLWCNGNLSFESNSWKLTYNAACGLLN